MQFSDRPKVEASIDSSGLFVLGDAVAGYSWPQWTGASYSDALAYLLENADRSLFEFGYYEYITTDGGATWDESRSVVHSNTTKDGTTPGFPNSTDGLTLSFVLSKHNVVASSCTNSDDAPEAAGQTATAVGPGSVARGWETVAVGVGVTALGDRASAFGVGQRTVWPGESIVAVPGWVADSKVSVYAGAGHNGYDDFKISLSDTGGVGSFGNDYVFLDFRNAPLGYESDGTTHRFGYMHVSIDCSAYTPPNTTLAETSEFTLDFSVSYLAANTPVFSAITRTNKRVGANETAMSFSFEDTNNLEGNYKVLRLTTPSNGMNGAKIVGIAKIRRVFRWV